ncbi:hypothetical protein CUJ84_pRLN1000580 (plasmid) [Rhizobium leguminosarum]|uniref:Uncharacterized protein n=1 Tax=Rhizobium leguminosarum TaxID=384 RepID=A0A2K9ZCT1_RHILE|nr:hypothetical protein CUJ84_pRLN1000580 [Rhizobium leguminosarum]
MTLSCILRALICPHARSGLTQNPPSYFPSLPGMVRTYSQASGITLYANRVAATSCGTEYEGFFGPVDDHADQGSPFEVFRVFLKLGLISFGA